MTQATTIITILTGGGRVKTLRRYQPIAIIRRSPMSWRSMRVVSFLSPDKSLKPLSLSGYGWNLFHDNSFSVPDGEIDLGLIGFDDNR
jgi:hypothetical protein